MNVPVTFMFPGVQTRLIAYSQSFRNSAAKDRVRADLADVLRSDAPTPDDAGDVAVDIEVEVLS